MLLSDGKRIISPKMFTLTKPTEAEADAFIQLQRASQLTYDDVASTRVTESLAHPGFNVDHNRLLLGYGRHNFERTKAALFAWKMFDMPWIDVFGIKGPQHSPLRKGMVIAIRIRHFGFWSLNTARIVYTFEDEIEVDDLTIERFGFAYGTLDGHAECGEERFSVEWHHDDDSVWYDIYAFSRPRHWLARLGKPIARMLQRRFVGASLQSMKRTVDAH